MPCEKAIQTIRPVGKNGSVLYIPRAIMKEWNRKTGDTVSVEVKDGALLVRPVKIHVEVEE